MNPYIIERGTQIVKDETLMKNPIEFIDKLLAFKQEIDVMVKESFQNEHLFETARDKSFEEFMN